MTPEKKAKEIFFAMLNAGKGLTSDFLAKQCAVICVDEILSCINPVKVDYWQSVKKSLQKL